MTHLRDNEREVRERGEGLYGGQTNGSKLYYVSRNKSRAAARRVGLVVK